MRGLRMIVAAALAAAASRRVVPDPADGDGLNEVLVGAAMVVGATVRGGQLVGGHPVLGVLVEPAGQRRELRRRVARATTNAMGFLWHTHEDRLDPAHLQRLVVLLRLRHRRPVVGLAGQQPNSFGPIPTTTTTTARPAGRERRSSARSREAFARTVTRRRSKSTSTSGIRTPKRAPPAVKALTENAGAAAARALETDLRPAYGSRPPKRLGSRATARSAHNPQCRGNRARPDSRWLLAGQARVRVLRNSSFSRPFWPTISCK